MTEVSHSHQPGESRDPADNSTEAAEYSSAEDDFGAIRAPARPESAEVILLRKLRSELQESFEPYFERSEDDYTAIRGVSLLSGAVREGVSRFMPYVDEHLMSHEIEEIVIQFLNHDQLRFASIMMNAIPMMREEDHRTEIYRAAVEYALDGRVRYGELEELYHRVQALHPSYLESDRFAEAMSFRFEQALEQRDLSTLRELSPLIGEVTTEPGATSDLKVQLVSQHQEAAREVMLEFLGKRDTEFLKKTFWLSDTLHESDAQASIARSIEEFLDEDDLYTVSRISEEFPLSESTIAKLREKAHEAAAREKARFAAGMFEELEEVEVQLLHRTPLSKIVDLFQLSGELCDPPQERRKVG